MLVAIDEYECMDFMKFSHAVTSLQERKNGLGGCHLDIGIGVKGVTLYHLII